MKNTKHTEMNDSSIEQDNQENLSQSKRKILTSIGVTSGVVGASALVPSTWVKPAVNSVILPAHAQQTPPMNGTTLTPTTTPMGMGPTTMMPTTMMPTTMMPTTMMPTTMMPTTMMPTTMMPTTMMPTTMMPAAGILLEKSINTGMVGDGSDPADPGITYFVKLREKPSTSDAMVTVMAAADTGGAILVVTDGGGNAGVLTFTRANYKMEQEVTVKAPALDAASYGVTVTFTAANGNYANVKRTDKFMVVEDDNVAPTMVTATKGTTFATRKTVTIKWTAPTTTKAVIGYVVSTSEPLPANMDVKASKTMVVLTNVPAGNHTFTVTAHFATGDAEGGEAADSVVIT